MNIQDFKSFTESTLTLAELKKPSKLGLRGDVLVKKITDKEPMKLSSGEDVTIETDIDSITDDGKYSPEKASDFLKKVSKSGKSYPSAPYIARFSDTQKDKEYKLTDFVKIGDFSGNERGTSLGTKDTRIVENIQTLMFAYKQKMMRNQNSRYLTIDFFNKKNALQILMQMKNDSAFISNVEIDDLNRFSSWFPTFIKTANAFVHKEGKGILSPAIFYNFYQISSDSVSEYSNTGFNKSLVSAYNRCCKETMTKSGKKNNRLINMAKWTPSDVWAINRSKESEIIEKLNDTSLITNIIDLNDLIDELFDTKDLVGLSLKKLPAHESRKLPIVINKETERPIYTIENFVLPKNPFTKSLKILLNKSSMDFKEKRKESVTVRNFTSGLSNIGIEIDGAASRQGKLTSFDTINAYLSSKKLKTLPSAKEISSSFTKNNLIKEIFNMDANLKKDSTSVKKRGRTELTKKEAKSLTKESLVCKYQALLFVESLIQSLISGPKGRKMANSIINSMMYYALSIENNYFVCPKYARVIDY